MGSQGGVLSTVDGGATWTPQSTPTSFVGYAMSCADSSHCWIAGYVQQPTGGPSVVATTDGGTTWTNQSPPVTEMLSISCPDAMHCWAFGSTGPPGGLPPPGQYALVSTSNGGASWATEPLPAGATNFGGAQGQSALDCVDTLHCWAVGQLPGGPAVLATSDGGATWTSQALPTGSYTLSSISCVDTIHCWAVGGASPPSGTSLEGQAVILATSDGGSTWAQQTPVSYTALSSECCNQAALSSIHCTDTSHCVAVGTNLWVSSPFFDCCAVDAWVAMATSDGGGTWTQQLGSDNGLLTSVWCANSQTCWVTGGSGFSLDEILATTTGQALSASFSFSEVPRPGTGNGTVMANLDGCSSNAAVSYAWTLPSGSQPSTTNCNSQFPLATGSSSVTLTVTDSSGATASVTKSIRLVPEAGFTVNHDLKASSGNTLVQDFNDCSSSGASESYGYVVTNTDSSQVASTFSHSGPACSTTPVTLPTGNYSATLTVTDTQGQTATATQTFVVTPIAGAITVTLDPANPPPGAVVVDLDACGSVAAATYEWTIPGQTSATITVNCHLSAVSVPSGHDSVALTVVDASGKFSSTSSVSFEAIPPPPPPVSTTGCATGVGGVDDCLGLLGWLFHPVPGVNRPPDFIQISVSAHAELAIEGDLTLTCDGNLDGSVGVGVDLGLPGLDFTAALGYVGDPRSPVEPTGATVDSFLAGTAAWVGADAAGVGAELLQNNLGQTGVLFTASAPSPDEFFSLSAGFSIPVPFLQHHFSGPSTDPSLGCAPDAAGFESAIAAALGLPSPPPSAPTPVGQIINVTQSGPTISVVPTQQFSLQGSGYTPGSPVYASLHSSNPVSLGAATVNADGTFTLVTQIPAGTPVGDHTVGVTGVASDGSLENTDSPVTLDATVPDAPAAVSATPGSGQATVSWSAPANDGGSPISGYTVTATPGGQTCAWSSGPLNCTVKGLSNGTAYTFTVTATNGVGTGALSAPSSSVTPATMPDPPTGVSGTSGNGQVSVSWAAPANDGGSAITGYVVEAAPGGKSCSWSSGPLNCTVTGLSNGTAYTFTVTATNSAGQGTSSAPSSMVTPQGDEVPLAPARLLDTRLGGATTDGQFSGGGAVPAGQSLDLTVTGRGGVPASGVGAVVLNVTATDPTAAGFVTVYPTGSTRPTASNLNFTAGESIPNLVIAKVGAGGKVSLYNFSGTTDLVVDVLGYFPSASTYTGLSPARLLDTRPGGATTDGQFSGGGAVPAGQSLDLTVTGRGGVPASGVGAVVLNVTATDPTAAGFVTVYPTGSTRPTASNLNFTAGESIPNLVIAKVGAGGKVSLYNFSGTTDLVVDVLGYFPSASTYTGLSPARLLDTRPGGATTDGQFSGGGAVPAGQSLDLTVTGRGGVPASGVGAVVLNVTATDPTAAGFVTVYPTGSTRPTASNLNFTAGESIPNLVIAKVGAGGKVSLYNFSGTTDLVVDALGYIPS